MKRAAKMRPFLQAVSELGPAWSTERMRKRLAGVMECVEFHSIAIQLMRLKSSPTYSRSIFTPRSAFTVRSQSSPRLFEVSRMSFWMCKLRRQWDDSACISRLIFCGLVKGIFPIFRFLDEGVPEGVRRKINIKPRRKLTLSNFRFNNFIVSVFHWWSNHRLRAGNAGSINKFH